MDWYHIILRIVHISAAVIWAGSSILFVFFIEPTMKAIGPAGEQFMGHVVGKRKMPVFITTAAGLTVVAGILLYWRASSGFDPAWITTPTGMAFTIGGSAATIAFLLGGIVLGPTVKRLGGIGAAVDASGGSPSPGQAAEVERLNARLTLVGRIDIVLIIIAVLTMAVARFL